MKKPVVYKADDEGEVTKPNKAKENVFFVLNLVMPFLLAFLLSKYVLSHIPFLSKVPADYLFLVAFAVVFLVYSGLTWGRKHNMVFYLVTIALFCGTGFEVSKKSWGVVVGLLAWLALSVGIAFLFKKKAPSSRESEVDVHEERRVRVHDHLPEAEIETSSADLEAVFIDPTTQRRVKVSLADLADDTRRAAILRLVEAMNEQLKGYAMNNQAKAQMFQTLSQAKLAGDVTPEEWARWKKAVFPEMGTTTEESIQPEPISDDEGDQFMAEVL